MPLARPRPMLGRLVAVVVLAASAALPAGCGYSIRPPYSKSIQTVYVPVFRSTSFKRDLNLQLTKKVQDEIMRRTPFRVVGSPEEADSTLEGTITFVDKNAMVESPFNLPRQTQATILMTIRWVDNKLSVEKKRELPPAVVADSVSFYHELGETAQLGFDKAMDKMARQIVDMMEEPW